MARGTNPVLREAKIILPTKADPRRPETQGDLDRAHIWLKTILIDTFGGVSIYHGEGAWRADNGQIVDEPHKAYVVAVKNTAEARRRLEEIAKTVTRMGYQDCVYFRAPNGSVMFLS